MRRYLLDTGPLAAYLRGRSHAVALIRPWLERDEVATSILAYGEVVEYLHQLPQSADLHRQLRRLLRAVSPYLLTYAVMERYAMLRRQMRPPRGPGLIGDVDTLISATTLECSLTVVTMDTDFQKIPGLAVQLLPR
jgi:predicted nucleic acid-binding protein